MCAGVIADDVQDVLTRMRGSSDLRVWSVIVTIMGDMVRGQSDQIAGTTLTALMGALGIRPEATRVALFRLRKDGWIDSQRAGRGSFYALTDHGLAETLSVMDRIYGAPQPAPETWHLAVSLLATDRLGCEDALTGQGFAELSPGVFLGTAPPERSAGLLVFSDRTPTFPDQILPLLVPTSVRHDARNLSDAVNRARNLTAHALPPLAKAALRVLVLHNWRRIALRLPDLPLKAFWPEATLREDVHALLNRLGPIDITALPQ